MNLSKYVKGKGVKSVRELAKFIGVRPETLNNWYNRGDMEMLDQAIASYKESKK